MKRGRGSGGEEALGWGREDGGGEGKVPRAFNSLHACSQALASRDEIYTFAPFATKPSEIIRPIPLAPPVTRTILSCVDVSEVSEGVHGWFTLTLKRLAASMIGMAYRKEV